MERISAGASQLIKNLLSGGGVEAATRGPPAAQAAQLRSAVALSVPPSPALLQAVKAVQAVASVANSVVPSHAVQHAVLSAGVPLMSHVAPAQSPVAPAVASKPAPQFVSDTASTPAVAAPFESSQLPKMQVTAPPSASAVMPSAAAVVPAQSAQSIVDAVENRPEAHSVHVAAVSASSVFVTEPAVQAMHSLSEVAAGWYRQ